MFENFKANPTLEAMLTFTGWLGGFSHGGLNDRSNHVAPRC